MEAAARWLAARLLRQRIHGALIHLSGSFTVANVGLRERVSQARGAGTEPQRRVDARRLGGPAYGRWHLLPVGGLEFAACKPPLRGGNTDLRERCATSWSAAAMIRDRLRCADGTFEGAKLSRIQR